MMLALSLLLARTHGMEAPEGLPTECHTPWDNCFLDAECTNKIMNSQHKNPNCEANVQCRELMSCWADHIPDDLNRNVPTDCREQFKECIFTEGCLTKLNSIDTEADFAQVECEEDTECYALQYCMQVYNDDGPNPVPEYP